MPPGVVIGLENDGEQRAEVAVQSCDLLAAEGVITLNALVDELTVLVPHMERPGCHGEKGDRGPVPREREFACSKILIDHLEYLLVFVAATYWLRVGPDRLISPKQRQWG